MFKKPELVINTAILKETERDVWTASLDRMRQVYDRFDRVIVSFSGGKDSTVCLHVALEIAKERGKLPLEVVHYDEEAVPLQVESYVRRVANRPDVDLTWYCIPIKHRNACSNDYPFWYTWNPNEKEKWMREMPPEAITGYDVDFLDMNDERTWTTIPNYTKMIYPFEEYGNVALVMGIRADESMTRRRAVTQRLHDNWIISYHENIFKVYPIYDWSVQDVWTAPNKFGWDYTEAYDLMEMAGITHSNQRVAPPFGEQPMRNLWMWSVCFPELWEKMCERVPGANTAGIYSKQFMNLYGFKGKGKGAEDVSLPEGMSWKQYLIHLISQHDGLKIRQHIAKKIQREIRSHYEKTSDPILPRAAHPFTGANYVYLCKIANRGDLKSRMQCVMDIGDDPAATKIKYDAKLAEYKEHGIDWEYSNE